MSERVTFALDHARNGQHGTDADAEALTVLADEVERLHSWAGLMELLDEHWPADIFPTLDDDVKRDAGARIVSLLRWVERLREQVADRPCEHQRAGYLKMRNERDEALATLAKVRELAHSTQADQYRDEAARGTAVMPYASNRYLRLLDDLRALLPEDEEER